MTERHIAHVCLVKEPAPVRRGFRARPVFPATGRPGAPGADHPPCPAAGQPGRTARRNRPTGGAHAGPRRLVDPDHPHHHLLNDHTVCRVIELTLADKRRPRRAVQLAVLWQRRPPRADPAHRPGQWHPLRGRRQRRSRAEIRGRLLPLAQQINQSLAQCGFTLCKGNIMAGNPELCLSRSEWARRFAALSARPARRTCWARASISTCGGVGRRARLRTTAPGLLDQVADNRLFQRMLAENALRQRPPVGRFREFVLTR